MKKSLPFLKLMTTPDTLEIIKNPNAFALLTLIAWRARRTNVISLHKLEIGEAFIGDHESCGLTRRQYRTSLNLLVELGLISKKTTNKGTVVKILGKRIFDINEDESDQQATIKRPTSDHQTATNKIVKNIRNKEIKNKSSLHQEIDKICSALSVTFNSLPETFLVYESRYHAEDIKRKAQDACVWMTEKGKGNELTISRLAHFLKDCPVKQAPVQPKSSEEIQEAFNLLVNTRGI